MAKRIKLREEQERKRLEEKQRKRFCKEFVYMYSHAYTHTYMYVVSYSWFMFVLFRDEFWQRNDYMSCNISLDSDSSDEESEGEMAAREGADDEDHQINYVVGDVTQPQNTGDDDAVIVHCVGEFTSIYKMLLRFSWPCQYINK